MTDAISNITQLFSQIMLHRGYLDLAMSRKLIHELNEMFDYDYKVETDAMLGEFLNQLNVVLSPLYLKLSLGLDEVSGDRVVVMTNTLASNLSLNPTLSNQERAVFKHIIHMIVESADGFIQLNQIPGSVQTSVENCTLNAVQISETVNKLMKQNYIRLQSDLVCLTPSALIELTPYITSFFPDQVSPCFGCQALCLNGYRCINPECQGKVHKSCSFRMFSNERMCRVCDHLWPSASGSGSRTVQEPNSESQTSKRKKNTTKA